MSFLSLLKIFISKLSRLLNISPAVGALEINDFELRFFMLKERGEKLSEVLKLAPGIIVNGKIANAEEFRKALLNLHSRIASRKGKKVNVILNIPDNDIFTKVFSLPFVDEENLKSAVSLNLQMISPMDFKSAYSDWQKVGEAEIDGGQIEILSAFVEKNIIDVIDEPLRFSNFTVVAVEFPGLSLARLIDFKISEGDGGVIFMRVSSGGLSFGIMKNGNLYFHHFIAWPTEKISLASLEEIVRQETRRILNFYTGNWSAPIRDFLVISPSEDLRSKISQIILDNFNLPVRSVNDLSQGYNQKSELSSFLGSEASIIGAAPAEDEWAAVLGSALRGLIPRSKDTIISLASVGTEEEFLQIQIRNFIGIWRNIVLTTLSLLVIIFFMTERFIVSTSEALSKGIGNVDISSKLAEYGKLQAQASAFNSQIDVAKQARGQELDWISFILKIKELAGNAIAIDRIYAPSTDGTIAVTARTSDRNAIVAFKNVLVADQRFSDVNMPLNFPPLGEITFTITFRAKTMDFNK